MEYIQITTNNVISIQSVKDWTGMGMPHRHKEYHPQQIHRNNKMKKNKQTQ